jgi:hypothetical protein
MDGIEIQARLNRTRQAIVSIASREIVGLWKMNFLFIYFVRHLAFTLMQLHFKISVRLGFSCCRASAVLSWATFCYWTDLGR